MIVTREGLEGAPRTLNDDERQATFVVLPTYNERPRIESTLRHLLSLGLNVVVVDDGSTDDSGPVAASFPVIVLRHVINLGQGAAIQTGVDYAVRHGAKYVVTFDADGQHDATDVRLLVRTLVDQRLDIVLGSRFLGSAPGMTAGRRLLVKGAVWFTRLTIGLRLTDAHNGLRAFRTEVADRIRITQNRMAHASEILQKISETKLKYAEVPVSVSYSPATRAKGQSALEAINIVYDLVLRRLVR